MRNRYTLAGSCTAPLDPGRETIRIRAPQHDAEATREREERAWRLWERFCAWMDAGGWGDPGQRHRIGRRGIWPALTHARVFLKHHPDTGFELLSGLEAALLDMDYRGSRDDEPATVRPGTHDKVAILRSRLETGAELWQDKDMSLLEEGFRDLGI
jgi:hypothetical protein